MMLHSVSAPSLTLPHSHHLLLIHKSPFPQLSLCVCLLSLGPTGSGVCGAETRHQLSMVLKHPNH